MRSPEITKEGKMGTIVTLSENLLYRYTDRELTDLSEYFDPSAILVDGNPPQDQVERVESVTRKEVLSQQDAPLFREIDDVVVGCVGRPSDIGELPEMNNLCIVSDFIRRETDMRTFETTISNFPEYRREIQELGTDPRLHLTTTLDAGESVSENGVEIHGIGVKESMEGTEIPGVALEGPRFDPLSADRVGLQAVPEVGRTSKNRLQRNGYESRRELMEADPIDLMEIDGIGAHYASLYPSGARAIENEEVVRFAEDPLREKDRVYLDIETDSLNPQVIWQIGVYDETTEEYTYFIENKKPGRKEDIIQDFAKFLTEELGEKTLVAWYGKNFDYEHLGRFIQRYAPEHYGSWEEIEKIDLLLDVAKTCVALPTRSFQLETVASRLGYERELEGLSGKEGADRYVAWMSGGEEPDWERWISYCRDDVISMKYVYDRIREAPKILDKQRLEKEYRNIENRGNSGDIREY
jgi:uncharacterized protein YprB with RNaseH-like and TPR domain